MAFGFGYFKTQLKNNAMRKRARRFKDLNDKFDHPKDEQFKMKDLSPEEAKARSVKREKEFKVFRKRKMKRTIFALIGALVIGYALIKVVWPAISWLIVNGKW